MEKPRVTLQTIATRIGVSKMTVSNALRNSPKVKPELKARILQVANRLGYRPDPVLTRLMTHLRPSRVRSYQGSIAFIISQVEYYTSALLESARARANELGYSLEVIDVYAEPMSASRRTRILRSRGIDGLILGPLREPGSATFLDHWEQFSVVAVSYSIKSPIFHAVVPSQFRNMMEALNQIRELGIKRPALVMPESFDSRVFHTSTAAMAWDAYHFGKSEVLVYPIGAKGVLTPSAWLRQHQPDALLIPDKFTAGKLLAEIKTTPEKCPIPLFGLLLDPEILPVGIDQNAHVVGKVAVDQLVGLIHRNERGVPATRMVTMIDGYWRRIAERQP